MSALFAERPINAGIVIDKRFTEANTTLIPVATGIPPNQITSYVPMHAEPAYEVLVEGRNHRATRQRWICTDKATYENTETGQEWSPGLDL